MDASPRVRASFVELLNCARMQQDRILAAKDDALGSTGRILDLIVFPVSTIHYGAFNHFSLCHNNENLALLLISASLSFAHACNLLLFVLSFDGFRFIYWGDCGVRLVI